MALTQEQINQAYQIALGRSADTGGAQFYANSGMDYSTLMNTLQASQEYQQLNPNASSGIGFNQSGVREDQTQQYMMNSAAYDMGMSAQELNKIINPFTYDAVNYTPSGYMALTQPTTQWDTQSNVPVTLAPEGARNLYEATMVSGMPTSYVDAMGGYDAMYKAAQQSPNFVSGQPSFENIQRFGNQQWLDTIGLQGNTQYTQGANGGAGGIYFNQAAGSTNPYGRPDYNQLTQSAPSNFVNNMGSGGYVSNAFPQYTPNYSTLTTAPPTTQQTNALMRPITPNSSIGGQQQQYNNMGYNTRRSSLWGDW
jgi:hypothetical protein